GLTDIMGNGVTTEVVARFSTGDTVVLPPPIDDPPLTGSGGGGGTGGSGSGFGTGGSSFVATGGTFGAPPQGSDSSGSSKVDQGGNCAFQAHPRTSALWAWFGAFSVGLLGLRMARRRREDIRE